MVTNSDIVCKLVPYTEFGEDTVSLLIKSNVPSQKRICYCGLTVTDFTEMCCICNN